MNAEQRLAVHYAKVRARCYGRAPTPKRPMTLPKLTWGVKVETDDRPYEAWHDIVMEVAMRRKVARRDIMGMSRAYRDARYECWWRIKNEYVMPGLDRNPSYIEIARWFGRQDHSTVAKGIAKFMRMDGL